MFINGPTVILKVPEIKDVFFYILRFPYLIWVENPTPAISQARRDESFSLQLNTSREESFRYIGE